MMSKLKKVFDAVTTDTKGYITDKQQFDYLTTRLLERKLIIEQDEKLFNIHIKDFPISFNNFTNYIMQIYKLDIENMIEIKSKSHEEILNQINKFMSFLSTSSLTNEDIVAILSSLIKNEKMISNSITNFKKSQFIIKSIRDDIQKFVWERIYQTMENKGEDFYQMLDVTSNDADEYQQKNQEKIQFEFEIIRVKKFHDKGNSVIKGKENNNAITAKEAFCSDRNIPIQCVRIPNIFYDKNILESFYFKCEASKELLLSKYFQKFLGFEDSNSNDDAQFYFFEHIEGGIKLIPFFLSIETENPETSFFFKYLAKEILCSFRDLLNKCTYSFKFPITCDNFYYDKNKFRLYLQNISYGPKRKSIMESHQIIEAKLLYFYGMILLNLLSLKYPGLCDLINKLNEQCASLEEFGKMQKVYDYIYEIENCLTQNLENDVIICIIIECLLTPYKAKIVFDEFYEKKNFLNKILEERKKIEKYKEIMESEKKETETDELPTKKKSNILNLETSQDRDKTAVEQPYYKNNEKLEITNETAIKKSLTINMLLVHPFYSNTNLDERFLRFLFKQNEDNQANNIN